MERTENITGGGVRRMGTIRASLALGFVATFAVGMLAGHWLATPSAGSQTGAPQAAAIAPAVSWQAYNSYRAGEWAAAEAPTTTSVTPWQAYNSYRAGEWAGTPDEIQAQFDAWLKFRAEERQ